MTIDSADARPVLYIISGGSAGILRGNEAVIFAAVSFILTGIGEKTIFIKIRQYIAMN